jgi:hypothetical protein
MTGPRDYYVRTREERAFDLMILCAEASRNGNLNAAKVIWAERKRLLAGESVWRPDPPCAPIRPMSLARRY